DGMSERALAKPSAELIGGVAGHEHRTIRNTASIQIELPVIVFIGLGCMPWRVERMILGHRARNFLADLETAEVEAGFRAFRNTPPQVGAGTQRVACALLAVPVLTLPGCRDHSIQFFARETTAELQASPAEAA